LKTEDLYRGVLLFCALGCVIIERLMIFDVDNVKGGGSLTDPGFLSYGICYEFRVYGVLFC
ncbi:hypothetical protein ACOV11_26655, partial [Vibrio natriegens]